MKKKSKIFIIGGEQFFKRLQILQIRIVRDHSYVIFNAVLSILTLIWVGFLGVRLEVGGEGRW